MHRPGVGELTSGRAGLYWMHGASSLKGHKPCMTLVVVAALAAPIFKVELDAWASSAI